MDPADSQVSWNRRATEAVFFWALLVLALAFLGWRWAGHQGGGLSGEQGESLKMARSLVGEEGLSLPQASTPSAGPENLAWLGAQILLLWIQGSPEVWLPRLSLALLALALVVLALRGALIWRRPVQVEDAFPTVSVCLAMATAEAAAQGSGSSGWMLAVALGAVFLGRGLTEGKPAWAAVAIGTLCLFTPAALWLLLAATVGWWGAARVEGRSGLGEALGFLIRGLAVAGLVLGLRWLLFGRVSLEGLLPSAEGSARTTAFLGGHARWLWAALAGALVAAVWRRFHLRGGGTVLMWVLMSVALANQAGAPRPLFLGYIPLLAMLAGDGLSAAREGLSRQGAGPLAGLSWATLLGQVMVLALAAAASY